MPRVLHTALTAGRVYRTPVQAQRGSKKKWSAALGPPRGSLSMGAPMAIAAREYDERAPLPVQTGLALGHDLQVQIGSDQAEERKGLTVE